MTPAGDCPARDVRPQCSMPFGSAESSRFVAVSSRHAFFNSTAGGNGIHHPGTTHALAEDAPGHRCALAAGLLGHGVALTPLQLPARPGLRERRDRRQGHRRQDGDLERQPSSTRIPATSPGSSAGSSPGPSNRRKLRTLPRRGRPLALAADPHHRLPDLPEPEHARTSSRRSSATSASATTRSSSRAPFPSGSTASSTARPPSTSSPG